MGFIQYIAYSFLDIYQSIFYTLVETVVTAARNLDRNKLWSSGFYSVLTRSRISFQYITVLPTFRCCWFLLPVISSALLPGLEIGFQRALGLEHIVFHLPDKVQSACPAKNSFFCLRLWFLFRILRRKKFKGGQPKFQNPEQKVELEIS